MPALDASVSSVKEVSSITNPARAFFRSPRLRGVAMPATDFSARSSCGCALGKAGQQPVAFRQVEQETAQPTVWWCRPSGATPGSHGPFESPQPADDVVIAVIERGQEHLTLGEACGPILARRRARGWCFGNLQVQRARSSSSRGDLLQAQLAGSGP